MSNQGTPPNPLAKSYSIAIVVGALTLAAIVAFVWIPREGVNTVGVGMDKTYEFIKRVAKDIDKVVHFRPVATVEGKTILEASTSISELSIREKPFEHTYSWKSTWMGSTKEISLKGTYKAKAGFDLSKPFSIEASHDMGRVKTAVPPVQINSLERVGFVILKEQDGWWNGITSDERQKAINALDEEAREALKSSNFLKETESNVTSQIEKIIREHAEGPVIIEATPLP